MLYMSEITWFKVKGKEGVGLCSGRVAIGGGSWRWFSLVVLWVQCFKLMPIMGLLVAVKVSIFCFCKVWLYMWNCSDVLSKWTFFRMENLHCFIYSIMCVGYILGLVCWNMKSTTMWEWHNIQSDNARYGRV